MCGARPALGDFGLAGLYDVGVCGVAVGGGAMVGEDTCASDEGQREGLT